LSSLCVLVVLFFSPSRRLETIFFFLKKTSAVALIDQTQAGTQLYTHTHKIWTDDVMLLFVGKKRELVSDPYGAGRDGVARLNLATTSLCSIEHHIQCGMVQPKHCITSKSQ
jgi:hypothetical protein